ncbi:MULTISPECIES: sensor histidine kinase [Bifidobacterium]|uniref:sensor histidine kinase n=1 Tax=Bifidobacterium TaxID=1678 RepID=UPI001BDC8BB8|nr:MULTISPECIES: hypothetical protein [Bifidobacterium]MBT1162710.1 hypothetical protein [Bifidobacterium sp. SO1]MBW3079372.1 hypothetical protein [Bifidobacterium simiiventris]
MNGRTAQSNAAADINVNANDPQDDCTTDGSVRNTVMNRLATIIIAASAGLTIPFAAAVLANGAVTIPSAMMIAVACVLSVVAYCHPLFAGYAVTLVWACACLSPTLAGGVLLMTMPVAVGGMLATRCNTRHGVVVTGAQLLTLTAGTMMGVVRAADDPAAMTALLLIPVAPLVGLLMAWKQRLDHAREAERELEQRRRAMLEQERRAAAATRIHDQVTNRLAYLILRIANDQAEWDADAPDAARLRAELADLSGIAQGVLDETRDVIGILDGSRPPVVETATDADPAGETAMLCDHLNAVAGRLEALGFTVNAAVSGSLPQRYSVDAVSELHDLIDETGNNIAKHAQPHTDCAIHVTLDDRQATLTSRNRMQTGPDPSGDALKSGTGLRAKAARIRRLGGTLDHTVRGSDWTLSARLPLHG